MARVLFIVRLAYPCAVENLQTWDMAKKIHWPSDGGHVYIYIYNQYKLLTYKINSFKGSLYKLVLQNTVECIERLRVGGIV